MEILIRLLNISILFLIGAILGGLIPMIIAFIRRSWKLGILSFAASGFVAISSPVVTLFSIGTVSIAIPLLSIFVGLAFLAIVLQR